MSTDLRIAVLTAGVILIAAAVVASLLRVAGRGPALAGAGPRLLMGLAGVGLVVWGLMVAHPSPTAASAYQSPAHPDPIVMAGSAFAGCAAPKQPAAPPNGATATRAQMIASDTQTRAFDAATNAYLACLDRAASDFARQYGAILNVRGLQQVDAMHTRIHNAAVDTDQAVADKFNRQLRIYKARAGTT